jgi:hypothetical protein
VLGDRETIQSDPGSAAIALGQQKPAGGDMAKRIAKKAPAKK